MSTSTATRGRCTARLPSTHRSARRRVGAVAKRRLHRRRGERVGGGDGVEHGGRQRAGRHGEGRGLDDTGRGDSGRHGAAAGGDGGHIGGRRNNRVDELGVDGDLGRLGQAATAQGGGRQRLAADWGGGKKKGARGEGRGVLLRSTPVSNLLISTYSAARTRRSPWGTGRWPHHPRSRTCTRWAWSRACPAQRS